MSENSRALVPVGQRGVVVSVARQITITEKLLTRIQAVQALLDVFYVPKDGSIEDGIAKIGPGGLISINEGRFVLDAPVTITKPLRIKGAGQELTIIASSVEGTILCVDTDGLFSLEDIGIIGTGPLSGALLSISAHKTRLKSCTLTGNIVHNDESSEDYGKDINFFEYCAATTPHKYTREGVRVSGCRDCVVENVHVTHCLTGMSIQNNTKIQLQHNCCEENGFSGIVFEDSSTGTAEDNICCRNKSIGISVSHRSHVNLIGNLCVKNREGIYFGDSSTGTAEDNICYKNEVSGISVTDQSNVRLTGNRCEENWDGINIDTSNSCTAESNICNRNRKGRRALNCGIYISGQGKVNLTGNRCEENGIFGIFFSESATGTAENNICIRNENNGIDVRDQCKVNLEGNRCEENGRDGICFEGSSTGTAEDNICCRNKSDGIEVNSQSEVNLIRNRCEENQEDGILISPNHDENYTFTFTGTGRAKDNICNRNKGAGIKVNSQSEVNLIGNCCEENQHEGILFTPFQRWNNGVNYTDTYTGTSTAVNNICMRNKGAGIDVRDQYKVNLAGNRCEENGGDGI